MQQDFEQYADEIYRGLTDGASNSTRSNRAISEPDQPPATFAPFDPFVSPNTTKLPSFPVECLPPFLRVMAKEVAESLQVDISMTAITGLTAAALAVQGKFVINPKPDWTEPLNLYAVVVAKPSERKSPVLSVMTQPLYDFEADENQRRAPFVEEFQTKRDVLRKKLSNMKEAAAKPFVEKEKSIGYDAIEEIQAELDELEQDEKKPLRLLTEDTTPEALISLMSDNDGRMGIMSDEGGIFDTIAGKYSNSRVNMDVFLKSYTGTTPLRVDRKGRAPEVIEHPMLTMMLMVQPIVLESIMSNREFAGRGLLARPLYSFPRSLVGHRQYKTPPVQKEVKEDYKTALYSLLTIKNSECPLTISLSPEADQEVERFFYALEPRLPDELEYLEGWATKYHGQVMRIAGIIHCLQHFQESALVPLSLETMKAAETIGEYFLEQSKAAFQIMGLAEKPEDKAAKYILKRLLANNQDEISKRDLFRLCDGRLHNMEDMEPGLNVLERRGYIRKNKVQTAGRPTEKVILNPEAKGH